ncbi:MAG TPA: NAD(P)/FAD-dependent oxidoreductase [Verrucomicrobiae bacterium]|nr:NAD(P)/FAD-dependent oxidoreductase [Verrucomicrobiae bacterium]
MPTRHDHLVMKKHEAIAPGLSERIVIVGGGFAGVALAQRLERLLPEQTEIIVLGVDNHLVFTPMLPEVAGRTISPLHIVVAGRQLTRRTKWLEARVSRIDREKNEAHYLRRDGTAASMRYTQLALACGAAANLEEIPGLASRGYALKTVMDAIVMGNDLIGNFETAATEPDAKMRQRLLTVAVIGGGFSGVEIAGHIADLMRAIHRFYPELKHEAPHVVLLQKGKQLLPELHHESLSKFTLQKLRKNGIKVRLETSAKKVDSVGVNLTSGERIETGMIVCTAGTAAHPLIKGLGLTLEKGRLKTDQDMKVSGTANLWGLGDCAFIPNAYDGRPCPATAQFAVQQARQLAENLKCASQGAATKPFNFRPRGMLASIGHRNAVAVIYGVKLSGFIAWFLWRGIYLAKLPTFSRKLEVALSWACNIPFPPNIVQLRLSKEQAVNPQKPNDKHKGQS